MPTVGSPPSRRTTAAAANLGLSNDLNIYFNVGSLTDGDVFTGGFYTDADSDFLTSISSANYQYFLADAGGAVSYGGNTYTAYAGPINVATVAQTANFGSEDVTGYTSQFTVVAVPEPSAVLLGGLGCLLLLRRRRA